MWRKKKFENQWRQDKCTENETERQEMREGDREGGKRREGKSSTVSAVADRQICHEVCLAVSMSPSKREAR